MDGTIRSGLAAAILIGCSAAASAQSDSCATPTSINGFGTFAFDLTTATTGAEGQNQAFCNFFAGTGVENDVWFCWTAPSTTFATFSTCGETTADTKIIIYEGCACPAVDGSTLDLACDDDAACGLQTEISFNVIAGTQYLIQLGTGALQGGTAAPGNLVISDASTSGVDDCFSAPPLSGEGSVPFDTTALTTGLDAQDFTGCGISGMIHNDAWFCWTPEQDGFYTISTCGSAFDTKLAVYEDFLCACPFSAPIACSDDGCGTQSQVTVAAVSLNIYLIQVGNAAEGVGGAGMLDIALVQGAGNDECGGAEVIAGTGTFGFSLAAATTSFDGQNCDSGAIANDVWFSWTAPSTAIYRFETCGLATFDTELAVYEGPGCPGICLDGDDSSCGTQSRAQINATQGTTYLVQVGASSDTEFGSGAFSITEFVPVANDECTTAQVIMGTGTFPFDNVTGTTGPDNSCDSGTINNDVWFRWTAPTTAAYRIETCGLAGFDTELAVYDASGCPGVCLDGNDDACGLQSRIEFSAVMGQEYLIQVGSFSASVTGSGSFAIIEIAPPPNDTCANAQSLSQGVLTSGTTEGAVDEGTTTSCNGGGADVWFRFVPGAMNTLYRAILNNEPGGTDVTVFNGCPSSGGTEIACGTGATVAFDSGALSEVWIRVGAGGSSGTFDILVDIPPAGDECESATPVTGLEPIIGSTIGAGPDDFPTCGTSNGSGGGLWYSFVGYGTQTTITTCAAGSDYDTKLRVYSGSCSNPICEAGDDDDACSFSGLRSRVTWFAESGVKYFILVHGFGSAEGNFELLFDLGLPVGACCVGGSCVMTVEPDCLNQGGAYRGDNTTCTDFTYGVAGGAAALEDISGDPGATALALANNSGMTVPIGFTFNFYGAPQTTVGVSDNGYLSFGGPLNVIANTDMPNTAAPNGLIAPLWDDFHPAPAGAGCAGDHGIYHVTRGTAPNRRFIVQWDKLPQFDFFGRCLDSNTFQAVLFESGDVEFRYGTVTSELVAGDYSVGIENAAGDAGTGIDGGTITSNSAIRLAAFVPATICADGPTCPCETDGAAGVDAFDLLAYLNDWFAGAAGADIDGTPGVDVFDLLFFLDCWFPASAGAPCP